MNSKELEKILKDDEDNVMIDLLMGEDELNPELKKDENKIVEKNVKHINQTVITENGKILLKD
jgi:hypothetical protein